MATEQYTYNNYPIIYKVFLLGQDISNDVKSISDIESSLDYPEINKYRVSEASFTLTDFNNNFNPQNDSNFYVTNGGMETPAITQSGYRSPVVIQAGFVVGDTEHLDTVYSGQILTVEKNAKNGEVRITCSDLSQKLRDNPVENFGLSKQNLVEDDGNDYHGNYPFYSGVTPISNKSVIGRRPGQTLVRKDSLQTEGPLDEHNFEEVETGIETEGGALDQDPILEYKAPFRYRTISDIIEKLLSANDISNSDVRPPIANNSGNYFSNVGRPGYNTESSDVGVSGNDQVWRWNGFVTDMIYNSSTEDLYFLYSSRLYAPRIIRHNLMTDESSIVAQGSASNEWWKFTTRDYDQFYVLGSIPSFQMGIPVFGSYDSSEINNVASSRVRIWSVNLNTTGNATIGEYVTNTNTYPPQLAMHYHLGFQPRANTSQNRLPNRNGSLPDSRRNLYLHSDGSTLYYPFATASTFGVAKTTNGSSSTRVMRAKRDEDGFNLANFDFLVEERTGTDYCYLGFTRIESASSKFFIVRGDA